METFYICIYLYFSNFKNWVNFWNLFVFLKKTGEFNKLSPYLSFIILAVEGPREYILNNIGVVILCTGWAGAISIW